MYSPSAHHDVEVVPNYIQINDTFRTVNRVVVDYSYCASLLCLYCLFLFELVVLASAALSSYCYCTDSP